MDRMKKFAFIYAAFGIVMNVVLGTAVSAFKIPLLFLDSIGTVLVAVLFGPLWGMATGVATNLVMGMTSGPSAMFFAPVSIAIALVAGLMAKRFDFKKPHIALLTGLILAIIAPLIGTPIAIAVFGGLNGSGFDFIVLWLRSSGESIFASTFISRITGNLVDKIATTLLVSVLLYKIPVFRLHYEKK